jgi:hypothetical protein
MEQVGGGDQQWRGLERGQRTVETDVRHGCGGSHEDLVNVKDTFMTGRAAEGDINAEALARRGAGRSAGAGCPGADIQVTDSATAPMEPAACAKSGKMMCGIEFFVYPPDPL